MNDHPTPVRTDSADPAADAFHALFDGLPRQGPGSDNTTRRLLRDAGRLPARPRILDGGCGQGRAALLLAQEAAARVTAVDTYQSALDTLTAEAARQCLDQQITTLNCSMDQLPFPDHSFDVIWCEGAVYTVGFDHALRTWHRLLAPGGVLVLTEIEWSTPTPSTAARTYWEAAYPLRTHAANTDAAQAAGYQVTTHWPLPESDWWTEYYTPLTARIAHTEPTTPGIAQAREAANQEIALRRAHSGDYHYAAYLLRPEPNTPSTPKNGHTMTTWNTRAETSDDITAIHDVNAAAFDTTNEADLVDALRADSSWIEGLSLVTTNENGTVVGHALLTRCHIGDIPALCLAPCAVLPDYQRTGAGSAAIRAALKAAKDMGEHYVTVLGHPTYYPRFGFTRASTHGIGLNIEVPDEALMAMTLDDSHPLPTGTIHYAAPFGI
ncbi:GNAT family N-acetyltransferase [Streptomyces sp. NBC_01387]|uniref:GNAT family N-acetyltransferase n=1 Tax=Streptomyces sp. NBC_01387 TaxID=2903849 RepID=UPI003248B1DD